MADKEINERFYIILDELLNVFSEAQKDLACFTEVDRAYALMAEVFSGSVSIPSSNTTWANGLIC